MSGSPVGSPLMVPVEGASVSGRSGTSPVGPPNLWKCHGVRRSSILSRKRLPPSGWAYASPRVPSWGLSAGLSERLFPGPGYVYETPFGGAAVRRSALGRFKHEAAAADPVRRVIYLTEDESDGRLYRFVPDRWGDLSSGALQALVAGSGTSGSFTWVNVPDPDGSPTVTRRQVSGAKVFNGGEGCYTPTTPSGSPRRATTGSGSSTWRTTPTSWRTTTIW